MSHGFYPFGCSFVLAAMVAGCTSATADRYLVIGSVADEHVLTEVAFPELTDPRRLTTDSMTSYRGGHISFDPYREGPSLNIRYGIQDGLAVPHDEDGLILWSFAYYLHEIQRMVGEMDLPLDGLYPVRMAYAPDMGDDANAFTNAAWACGPGAHLFVVLPDMFTELVPVGAHQGVIRHEFGHALFGHLTSGGSPACPEDPSTIPGNWALWNEANEGFADILATLTLDDPVFMNSALPLESRDVRLDTHVASEELYVLGLQEADPYLAGSVLAAFAWDIREAVGPELPLQAALTASQRLRFIPDERPEEDLLIVLEEMALEMIKALVDHPDALAAACQAMAVRFPHRESDTCSS